MFLAVNLHYATMFTPKQVADNLNLSSTTIRNYSRLWSDYLSPAANPEAGQPRLYSEDDLAVIATIAALRDNQATTDQIRAALDAGQRLEPVRPPVEEPPADRAGDGPTVEAAAAAAAATTAIDIYRDRVNQLEARADQLADRLIEAEKRAAAAEKELEVMRALYEAATSPTPADRRPTFWQWFTGRK